MYVIAQNFFGLSHIIEQSGKPDSVDKTSLISSFDTDGVFANELLTRKKYSQIGILKSPLH